MAKFIGELSKAVRDGEISPEQAKAQMEKAVFGENIERDKDGDPVEKSAGSDWSIQRGLTPQHRLESHLRSIELRGPTGMGPPLGTFKEAADAERDRIRNLQRSSGQKVTV